MNGLKNVKVELSFAIRYNLRRKRFKILLPGVRTSLLTYAIGKLYRFKLLFSVFI